MERSELVIRRIVTETITTVCPDELLILSSYTPTRSTDYDLSRKHLDIGIDGVVIGLLLPKVWWVIEEVVLEILSESRKEIAKSFVRAIKEAWKKRRAQHETEIPQELIQEVSRQLRIAGIEESAYEKLAETISASILLNLHDGSPPS